MHRYAFAGIFLIALAACRPCLAVTILDPGATKSAKASFQFGADIESFVNKPADFSRWTNPTAPDSRAFAQLLEALGKPVLRLASLQRWDWRGRKETLSLVRSPEYQTLRVQNGLPPGQTDINYNFFSAGQFFDFASRVGFTTIPMLDVRFFYDAVSGTVKDTPLNSAAAAKQYARGYAQFIKDHGYDVAFWEIGNEEYLSRYHFSPEQYAQVARAFIKAILEINPRAKFGIQLYLFDFHPEWRDWSIQVLRRLKDVKDHIDYGSLHYYGDSIFSDKVTGKAIRIVRDEGYARTRFAVTEWRHSAKADSVDQLYKTASVYAKFLMFMLRQPDIDIACVHAFPFFGGLAEWSDGHTWTSFDGADPSHARKDTVGQPRWRMLPFGLAQRMILDSAKGNILADYKESPDLSLYLFRKPVGGYSLVLINAGASAKAETVLFKEGTGKTRPWQRASGSKLDCRDPNALPTNKEPQPWQVLPVTAALKGKPVASFDVSRVDGGIRVMLEPYQIMTLNLE